MRSPRKHRIRIYRSWGHLIATLFIVAAPFVFLLLFSQFAQIALSKLLTDTLTSLWRIVAAYLLAAVFGWLMAVLFYQGKRALVVLPLFDVLQSFPVFAALPLATYFWGRSSLTIIIFLIVTIIWPIFFSIISSLKLVRRDWQEAVAITGLTGFNYLKTFLFPITIPGLITGSIIGLGDAWEALVATEIIVGVKSGLGFFFASFSQNTAITAFGILGFLILIFSINKLIWLPLLDWGHQNIGE